MSNYFGQRAVRKDREHRGRIEDIFVKGFLYVHSYGKNIMGENIKNTKKIV